MSLRLSVARVLSLAVAVVVSPLLLAPAAAQAQGGPWTVVSSPDATLATVLHRPPSPSPSPKAAWPHSSLGTIVHVKLHRLAYGNDLTGSTFKSCRIRRF